MLERAKICRPSDASIAPKCGVQGADATTVRSSCSPFYQPTLTIIHHPSPLTHPYCPTPIALLLPPSCARLPSTFEPSLLIVDTGPTGRRLYFSKHATRSSLDLTTIHLHTSTAQTLESLTGCSPTFPPQKSKHSLAYSTSILPHDRIDFLHAPPLLLVPLLLHKLEGC